ncbi:aldehyde dehydrogenase family protein [Mycoplasma buteonis]|uniref:aldehyde dehydrogenase family protein n=1 Tax=Mycoplasma buteonis TaxID=171280 RepID=UPI00068D1398|nr:aldehyde dehydrogenase family protein [Mycoplasma buteonis]
MHKNRLIKEKLRNLKRTIIEFRPEIYDALAKDLNKSINEVEMTEILPTINEINLYLRKINKWSKSEFKITSASLMFGKTRIEKVSYGKVMIISPWNYPINLAFIPLIDAFGSGNTVILKLSERASNTAKVIEKIIEKVFTKEEVSCYTAGVEKTNELINSDIDFLFFTGSHQIGKIIYQKAAEKMIPCVLELGGKNPVIVTQSANLQKAADEIIFGKVMNAGQTCLAPDHIYVHKSIQNEFEKILKDTYENLFISENQASFQKSNLVDINARNRLAKFNLELEFNNQEDLHHHLKIVHVDEDSPLMQEEIFAPILPILAYENLTDLVTQKLIKNDVSLAAYIFTTNRKEFQFVKNTLQSGTFVQNSMSQFIYNSKLPFGGVKGSGIGRYHGKAGFDTFTYKRIVFASSSTKLLSTAFLNKIMFSSKEHFVIKWFKKFKR